MTIDKITFLCYNILRKKKKSLSRQIGEIDIILQYTTGQTTSYIEAETISKAWIPIVKIKQLCSEGGKYYEECKNSLDRVREYSRIEKFGEDWVIRNELIPKYKEGLLDLIRKTTEWYAPIGSEITFLTRDTIHGPNNWRVNKYNILDSISKGNIQQFLSLKIEGKSILFCLCGAKAYILNNSGKTIEKL